MKRTTQTVRSAFVYIIFLNKSTLCNNNTVISLLKRMLKTQKQKRLQQHFAPHTNTSKQIILSRRRSTQHQQRDDNEFWRVELLSLCACLCIRCVCRCISVLCPSLTYRRAQKNKSFGAKILTFHLVVYFANKWPKRRQQNCVASQPKHTKNTENAQNKQKSRWLVHACSTQC